MVYHPPVNGKLPAILMLHGGGGKPENTLGIDGELLLNFAREKGFLIAYPEGIDKKWNDLRDDPTASQSTKNRDDVGFIKKLIDTLVESHSVQKDNIYLTGISNGGMMSFRLACEIPEVFREIFPVTANMPLNSNSLCFPKSPVSITVFNGREDPLIPYNGGTVKLFRKTHGEVISTDDSMKFWAKNASCGSFQSQALEKKHSDDPTKIIHHKWNCPNNRVELFEIQGGGHTWPGGIQFLPEFIVGKTTKEMEASRIIVERMFEKE